MYLLFINKINFSNKILVVYPKRETFKNYKYCVRYGNNSGLVKATLKTRWWWSEAQKNTPITKINLYWQQWNNCKFSNSLPRNNIKKKIDGTY